MKDKDVKYGMQVRTWNPNDPDGTVWEVLDRAPLPGRWWLHRRDEEGKWKVASYHRNDFAAMEDRQPALV